MSCLQVTACYPVRCCPRRAGVFVKSKSNASPTRPLTLTAWLGWFGVHHGTPHCGKPMKTPRLNNLQGFRLHAAHFFWNLPGCQASCHPLTATSCMLLGNPRQARNIWRPLQESPHQRPCRSAILLWLRRVWRPFANKQTSGGKSWRCWNSQDLVESLLQAGCETTSTPSATVHRNWWLHCTWRHQAGRSTGTSPRKCARRSLWAAPHWAANVNCSL